MKPIYLFYLIGLLFGFTQAKALARDTHVNGYYRSNGTYVQPHMRSAPDNYKWNNYGRENTMERKERQNTGYGGYSNDLYQKKQRDYDHDGTPNYLDHDDNNNGLSDDNE